MIMMQVAIWTLGFENPLEINSCFHSRLRVSSVWRKALMLACGFVVWGRHLDGLVQGLWGHFDHQGSRALDKVYT